MFLPIVGAWAGFWCFKIVGDYIREARETAACAHEKAEDAHDRVDDLYRRVREFEVDELQRVRVVKAADSDKPNDESGA